MKRSIIALVFLTALSSFANAQNPGHHTKDETTIRTIVTSLNEAWTKADARSWGEQFAEDADFTVWTGTFVKGREAIIRGHEEIFRTIYQGTKLQLKVRSVRFLRDDVAVVHAEGSVVKKEEEFPAAPQVVPVCILIKEKGSWRIAVFQNTKVQAR